MNMSINNRSIPKKMPTKIMNNFFHLSSYIPLIHIHLKELVFLWFVKNFGRTDKHRCIPNPMWIKVYIPHKIEGNTIKLGVPSVQFKIPKCCERWYNPQLVLTELTKNNDELTKTLLTSIVAELDKKSGSKFNWLLEF